MYKRGNGRSGLTHTGVERMSFLSCSISLRKCPMLMTRFCQDFLTERGMVGYKQTTSIPIAIKHNLNNECESHKRRKKKLDLSTAVQKSCKHLSMSQFNINL